MEQTEIHENRKQKRWDLKKYLSVFENDTKALMGYLQNITTEGMRIFSHKPIPEKQEFFIWIQVLTKKIDFRVRCIWCVHEETDDIFQAGFEFVNPNRKTLVDIGCLVDALKMMREKGNDLENTSVMGRNNGNES